MEVDKISIIIPTLNDEETLAGILESVRKTEVPHEILVIDGGSDDRTKEIAEKYNCKVFDEIGGNKSPANAKNQGVELSEGKIVLFLEGDLDHLSPNFLEKVREAFRDGADAITWKNEPVEDTLSEKLFNRFHRLNLFMLRKEQPKLIMALRKSLFKEVGGFTTTRYGEDLDLDRKLREEGIEVKKIDATSYYHKVHSFYDLFKQALWVGETRYSIRRDLLFLLLFISLISIPITLLTILVMPLALLYLGRIAAILYLAINKRDFIYLLVPASDLTYSLGYLIGRLNNKLQGGE
ncbi:hypothetical protein C9439_03840 [archaeon SCG-AAA382B04]|nr:hypothetical protein C9439_03840 [archaeon SCG-AAA382B04]